MTLFSFSRFSRERFFFYMMKKSRRWEEWRKRVAGATGCGGFVAPSMYRLFTVFLATSYELFFSYELRATSYKSYDPTS